MREYTCQEWLTFNQAKALGGSIRKGEKGVRIIFYKVIGRDDEEATGEDEESRVIPIMRHFTVFNLDQIEGIERPEWTLPEGLGVDAAEKIIEASGAEIMHGGDRASYIPKLDLVRMPDKERFEDAGAYYATVFHELTHWTGHQSRLARDGIIGSHKHGTPEYAYEELVAELGAAFLCAEVGIEGELRHEEYIGSWLEVLKGDKRAISERQHPLRKPQTISQIRSALKKCSIRLRNSNPLLVRGFSFPRSLCHPCPTSP